MPDFPARTLALNDERTKVSGEPFLVSGVESGTKLNRLRRLQLLAEAREARSFRSMMRYNSGV